MKSKQKQINNNEEIGGCIYKRQKKITAFGLKTNKVLLLRKIMFVLYKKISLKNHKELEVPTFTFS